MKKRKRLRIAVFVENLSYPMQKTIMQGIQSVCLARDLDCVVFPGQAIKGPQFSERMRNILYNFFNPQMFDGCLMPWSTLTRFLSEEDRCTFLKRFARIPLLSIGSEIPGIPSVTTDHKQGMMRLMKHVIECHGAKKIALFRGVEHHISSNEREAGFRQALEEYGLEFYPEAVCCHKLNILRGRECLDRLLDERKFIPDTIITTNDNMAIGAIQRLQERGIRVPEDVKVCGYQGLYDNVLVEPPLTTMDEAIFDQALVGVDVLLRMIGGERPDPVTLVPSRLIIRESCGCLPQENAPDLSRVSSGMDGEDKIVRFEQKMKLQEGKVGQDIILLKYKEFIFSLQRHEIEKFCALFNSLAQTALESHDFEKLVSLVSSSIGMRYCALSLYETEDQTNPMVRLRSGLIANSMVSLPKDGLSFDCTEILPPGMQPENERSSLIMMPLYDLDRHFGLLLMEMNVCEGLVYEAIQALASNAVHTILRYQSFRESEQRFSDFAYTAADWLWELSREGRFTFSTDGSERILGIPRSEIIGMALEELLDESEKSFKEHFSRDLLSRGQCFSNLEAWFFGRRGKVALELSGIPLTGEGGEVTGYRGMFRNITHKKANEERMEQMAFHDALTGLPNRALFRQRLETGIQEALRDQIMLALLFFDMDHFKEINDNLGHEAGDLVLKEVAVRFKKCIRGTDTLCRYGGDEFLLLLPKVAEFGHVIMVAEKIMAVFSEPVLLPGTSVQLSFSMGIAHAPAHGSDGDVLLQKADAAMYHAKKNGRNQYALFEPSMLQCSPGSALKTV